MIIKSLLIRKCISRTHRRMKQTYQFFYKIKIVLTRKKNSPMVFGIGFPKTGTSSLDHALGILGYRNIHWPRAHHKPRCGWIEYIRKSPFDAFSDAPIFVPEVFKEIDKAFPGSKFIFTVREPKKVLKSWENYFVNAPWSIKTDEDRQHVIDRYNNHYKTVMEYFKDRPSDFLVLDIIGGEGWEKLCPFLGKPIPDVPFPRKRVAKYKKKK